ncbi:MAG: GAF domain-containing protein [Chloroflexi bacterium]|nr:GAF domain-containing protein [Chloroflexota bacterium]
MTHRAANNRSPQKNGGPRGSEAKCPAAQEHLHQADKDPSPEATKEIAALNAIAATVSGARDLQALLHGTLRQVLDVLQLPAGWIFLHQDGEERLTLAEQQGLSPAFALEEETLPLGDCACAEVLRTGQARLVSDMTACPRLSTAVVQAEGLIVHASVPLKSKNQVMGIMNVATRDARLLDGCSLQLLTAIGHQIGVAIENMRTLEPEGPLQGELAHRERATLRSVMDSMVDGLILVDTGGKINYWNPRAWEFLGIPAAAASGQPALGIARRIALGSRQPQQVSQQLVDAMLHFQSFPVIEYELMHPQHRVLQSLFFPINGDQGEDLGYGITLRDVTRDKELDKMKLQLLSTVSHELRTPLASIKGFTTTLLRQDVQWDEATRRDFLHIIDQESDRLSELVSNLLDMSRIEAGALSIDKEDVQIQTLLQETIEAIRMQTSRHSFVLEVPTGLPRVLADPRRIRQLVHNLLDNAVKYSPDGGQVTVRARPTSQHLTVSVSDQGMGIPTQQQKRVFERFFQVDNAPTRRVGGSGLGLAICRGIVEAHGGRIWFESEPGRGSTFYFTLPWRQSSSAEAEGP